MNCLFGQHLFPFFHGSGSTGPWHCQLSVDKLRPKVNQTRRSPIYRIKYFRRWISKKKVKYSPTVFAKTLCTRQILVEQKINMKRLNEKKVRPAVNGGTLRACFIRLGLTIVAVVEFGTRGILGTSVVGIERLSVGNKWAGAYCYC